MTKKANKDVEKKNAADLTLRNIRQANRRIAALDAELEILKSRVQALERRPMSAMPDVWNDPR